MEFRVLGTLSGVGDDGVALSLGGRGDRALLAMLLVRANTVVPVDVLADELWDGAPPARAAGAVQSRVSRLRRALGPAGGRIVTHPPGYVVRLETDELDATRFRALVDDGRAALSRGDALVAAERLAAGLALWRGPALGDVAVSKSLVAQAAQLEETRLAAVEDRAEAELACGRHHALVGDLEIATRAHPWRERLWGHLMIALYRCGRRDEALRAFQRVRHALAEDLGLEPGPALTRLGHSIAAESPELDLTPPLASERARGPHVRAGGWGPSGVPAGVSAGRSPKRTNVAGIVTLLFTDLVASTSLLDQLGDDGAERVRRTHFALLREAVAAHNGREVKNLGDGLMVVFASAVDGVAAAVEIQQAIARHNRSQAAADGVELAVRIGVHVGDPIEDEGDYFGTPVVTAARLCDAASGGQILASSLMEALVGSRAGVTFAPVGAVACRGAARPLDVVEVLWVASPRHRLPLPPAMTQALWAPATGLTGRDGPVGLLRAAWAAAVDGRRSVALVSGEPGIGKTRLLAELAQAAHDSGGTVLSGQCDEGLEFPAQPFVEALRQVLDTVPIGWLAAGLGADALAGLRQLVPLALGPAEKPAGTADPEVARYRTFETVDEVLGLLADDAPVVLVLDDLHCADPATLRLLRHLGRHTAPCRLLVVGAYRDVEVGPRHPLQAVMADLREEHRLTAVALAGLAPAEVGQLVAELGETPLDGDGHRLADRLHEVSGGNPMLVREMFAHLVSAGAVAAGPQGWQYDTSLAPDTLPAGVQEIIERRLRRMSEEANRILTLASVVGPDFALEVVEEVSDATPSAVLEAVEEGVAAKVISEIAGTFARYRFQHQLVHQTLVRRTSRARRDRLQRRLQEVTDRLGLV